MKYLFFLLIASLLHGIEIRLDHKILEVEIADTPNARKQGLMKRTDLQDGTGMLFIFGEQEILSFWMKNTPLPLSIAFFDKRGILINTADMKPYSLASSKSQAPALYALEVPQGWFAANKIGPGAKLSFRHQNKKL